MLARFKSLSQKGWAAMIAVCLALTVMISLPSPERIGDRVQIALPLLAFGCSLANGRAGIYVERAGLLAVAIHGPRNAIGDHPWNARPDGGSIGLVSGHTAAATFGASALLRDCVSAIPWIRAPIIFSAAFVGASRIESDRHTIWQVLLGGILGLALDRLRFGPLWPRIAATFARGRARLETRLGQRITARWMLGRLWAGLLWLGRSLHGIWHQVRTGEPPKRGGS
jgi:membrane-associated phospholipid phosphatase